jgi:hypothetical protein
LSSQEKEKEQIEGKDIYLHHISLSFGRALGISSLLFLGRTLALSPCCLGCGRTYAILLSWVV